MRMRLRDFDPDPSRQEIACRSGCAAGRSCPSVGRIRCARRTARSASGRAIRTPGPDDRDQAAESFGDSSRFCGRGRSPPPFGGPLRARMSADSPHRRESARRGVPAGRSEPEGPSRTRISSDRTSRSTHRPISDVTTAIPVRKPCARAIRFRVADPNPRDSASQACRARDETRLTFAARPC